MTPEQVDIIRSSWQYLAPIADQAVPLFYERLFETAPEIKPLFANADMPAQHMKLLAALNLAVENAENMNGLTPALEEMGRRHVSYGVEANHYEMVGQALLWTLEQGLGSAFVDDVRTAWSTLYAQVSGAMMNGAHDDTPLAA